MNDQKSSNRKVAQEFLDISVGECKKRIFDHEFYRRLAAGELPLKAVCGYFGELYPLWRETVFRDAYRAVNAPYKCAPIFVGHAAEEYGHADELLENIEHLGFESTPWKEGPWMYETEAVVAFVFRISVARSYLENAVILLGGEHLFSEVIPLVRNALAEKYDVPKAVLGGLDDHEEAG